MAGSDPRFNAALFRQNIEFAMNMGMPSTAPPIEFIWNKEAVFAQQDSSGMPFRWTDTAQSITQHAPVTIPVAVEPGVVGPSEDTAVGLFNTPSATITVLDTYIDEIAGATHVKLNGNLYEIVFIGPTASLFEVDVYTLHVRAVDES